MTSKKKRFGTLSVVGEGISAVLRNADNATHGLNIEQVPLGRIDPDPDNPRRLGIDRAALARYAAGEPVPDSLRITWAALSELAQSIREIGVQQAIKCYRYGDRFRIAFGERRFLASLLAGRETIPAWILDERPPFLRRIQYAENVHRQSLSPWERISNVQAFLEEYQTAEGKAPASRGLADLLGVSHTQANAYLTIIRGPAEVRDWLREARVTTLDGAAALARMEEPRQRQFALEALNRGDSIRTAVEVAKVYPLAQEAAERPTAQPNPDPHPPETNATQGGPPLVLPLESTPPAASRGRPTRYVNLGRTTRPEVVRKIIGGLGRPAPEIDWDDLGAVSRAWIAFLQALERDEP